MRFETLPNGDVVAVHHIALARPKQVSRVWQVIIKLSHGETISAGRDFASEAEARAFIDRLVTGDPALFDETVELTPAQHLQAVERWQERFDSEPFPDMEAEELRRQRVVEDNEDGRWAS